MALLEVNDIHTYYGNIHALKGISLHDISQIVEKTKEKTVLYVEDDSDIRQNVSVRESRDGSISPQ